MKVRQVGAYLLAVLTACSSTPAVVRAHHAARASSRREVSAPPQGEATAPTAPGPVPQTGSSPPTPSPRATATASADGQGQSRTAWYELVVLVAHRGKARPVQVTEKDFKEALALLTRELRPGERPAEAARRLLELPPTAYTQAGRKVPVRGEAGELPPDVQDPATLGYLHWCQESQGGGDCFRLLEDGPRLQEDDKQVLALALALGPALQETKHALRESVQPQALVSMVLWTAALYLLLWTVPEPASKGLAAAITIGMTAWLTVDTVWSLFTGWQCLVEELKEAHTFALVRAAGERFGNILGENAGRVVVMLATTALFGTLSKFGDKLRRLPGAAEAEAQLEMQAISGFDELAQIDSVFPTAEAEFAAYVSKPMPPVKKTMGRARRPARSTDDYTTVVRHREGNLQVEGNGKRWHVTSEAELSAIPLKDPVGDALQATTTRAAGQWDSTRLSIAEQKGIARALEEKKYWLASLLEREARGRFVEQMVREQFKATHPTLQWNHRGVDVIDSVTGLKYEILSGSNSNMARHGRRMAGEFFRMITF